MTTPQPPAPASSNRTLPPVTIDGHALFEFSMRMNRALKRLEKRFDARETGRIPTFRCAWQPLPQKPR